MSVNKFGDKGTFDTSGDELNMNGNKIVGLPITCAPCPENFLIFGVEIMHFGALFT